MGARELASLRAKMNLPPPGAVNNKSSLFTTIGAPSLGSWTSDSTESKWSSSCASSEEKLGAKRWRCDRCCRCHLSYNNWALVLIPLMFLALVATYFIVIDVTLDDKAADDANLVTSSEEPPQQDTATLPTSPFARQVNIGLLDTPQSTPSWSTRLTPLTTRVYHPPPPRPNSTRFLLKKAGQGSGTQFVLEGASRDGDVALQVVPSPNLTTSTQLRGKVYEHPPRRRKPVVTLATPPPITTPTTTSSTFVPVFRSETEVTTKKPRELGKRPSILEELFAAEVARGGFGSSEAAIAEASNSTQQSPPAARPITTPRGFQYSATVPLLARLQAEQAHSTEHYNVTQEAENSCFSPRLGLCEGILPYDMVQRPAAGVLETADFGAGTLDVLLPYLQLVLQSGCSRRARQFICAVLQPECTPAGVPPSLPCNLHCKVVADECKEYILETLPLSRIFDCSKYPTWHVQPTCVNLSKGNCFAKEYQCPDGSCIPHKWRCDGVHDCPGTRPAADELTCSGCADTEFRCIMDGKCVPGHWRCDGQSDCGDNSDEAAC